MSYFLPLLLLTKTGKPTEEKKQKTIPEIWFLKQTTLETNPFGWCALEENNWEV